MNVVWSQGAVTAAEVHAALAEKNWHAKTVGTFLNRLVAKGAIKVDRESRTNIYTAVLSQEDSVRQESMSFLDRVFGGALRPMMMHFVEHAELNPDDVDELKRLLDQRAKKKRRQ